MRKFMFSIIISAAALLAFAVAQAKFSFGFAVEKPRTGVSFGFGSAPKVSVCKENSSCCTEDFCPSCPECIAQVDREYRTTKRYKQMQELDELKARRRSIERKIAGYEKKLESLEYDLDCVGRRIKNLERAL